MTENQAVLTDFQVRVEARLHDSLAALGLEIDSRRLFREKVPFLRQDVESVIEIKAGDLDVGIRERSVSFEIAGKGEYWEAPDYATADELADAFLKELVVRWRKHVAVQGRNR